MSLKDQTTLRIVLYEGQGAQSLANDDRFAAVTALIEKGYTLSRARADGTVDRFDRHAMLVLGRFDQAPSLLSQDGVEAESIAFQDIGGMDAPAIVEKAEQVRVETNAAKHGEWKPWFPVIDYDRCTNCMQCLSFCLFNVYGVDGEQRIQVQNNDNCKTNCPACSRVCPEAAIMFPKYKSGPINGDVVNAEDLQREKMKVDISSLLGGDIYAMLRQRSEKAKSRFSKERDANKALTERQKCLTKLAQAGDIPAEVLMSLPSPEEIQRRAEEAKSKAEAALSNRAGGKPQSN
jgi:Pyruvate/2-oxoacid:ferredoxin oxidoreductase delta subunit